MPGGPGCPFPVEYFKPNRWTRCESADPENPLEVVETEDNRQAQGDCEGAFEWWTGWTVFPVHGYDRPQHFPWGLEEPIDGAPESGHGEGGEPESEGSRDDGGDEEIEEESRHRRSSHRQEEYEGMQTEEDRHLEKDQH